MQKFRPMLHNGLNRKPEEKGGYINNGLFVSKILDVAVCLTRPNALFSVNWIRYFRRTDT